MIENNGMLVCSVLIPSRTRPERLKKTIWSVLKTSSWSDRVEVIVRIDDDDVASTREIEAMRALGARVLVGPRYNGYASLHRFYAELADAASAPWIWIMNDDAWVHDDNVVSLRRIGDPTPPSRTWDAQLAAIPCHGHIVQPGIYQLGGSVYHDVVGSAFPLVPNSCWKQYGHLGIGDGKDWAVDTWLDSVLRRDQGWQTTFLQGIRVVHDRDDDATLAAHRRID